MNLNARTVDSETTELTMKQTEIKDLRKHITEGGRLRSLSEMMNTNDLHHKALEKANNISLKRPNLTESILIQTSKLSYNSHYCVGNVSNLLCDTCLGVFLNHLGNLLYICGHSFCNFYREVQRAGGDKKGYCARGYEVS